MVPGDLRDTRAGRKRIFQNLTAAANAAEVCTPTPGMLIRAWLAGEARLIAL